MPVDLDIGEPAPAQRVALVDLLDRLLAGGVVITGDLVISIAEVDLVQVSLRALITTVRADLQQPFQQAHEQSQQQVVRHPVRHGPQEDPR
ncbi:gas vesicle protein [Actinomadura kijaniata]|uniref:gas vesicle protein n=1 Tax=Actinomadura kijaniata TaxID=46161 RepID=UPI00082F157A|nr:gas vesicle protein [Actinomadura kijaniata]